MPELYQIVDAQDNPVGFKLRNDIDSTQDYFRVSALWLTNSIGQILIAQRVLTKDNDPGKWGPAAAGTVEKGETYAVNMYKEAEEEIGLQGITFSPGPKMRVETPRRYFVQWFFGKSDMDATDFKPQPSEVAQVKWIDRQILIRDLVETPEMYVPTMPLAISEFCVE